MKDYIDYHLHTEFSDDCTYDMEQVILDAIEKGIEELCFTDHVDYGIKRDWAWGDIQYRHGEPIANVDYPAFFEKFNRMKEKYGNRIRLKAGMEFGMQSHTIAQFEELYKKYSFDFIILSIHQIRDLEFWTGEYQQGRSQKEYNDEYYEELLNVIQQYKDYSVLGHLDLIQRYDPAGFYPFEKNREIITKILKQIIADGKGIEVNTSWHRYKLPDLQPSTPILKLYKELGGTIITIGSDSHKPEHLGAYIQETQEKLKELGFEYYCTYENMEPIFHRL
ncbi:MAG: histidinol-phosphatase HisJ family protein [Bacillota bacterium]|nr:histidinol-phosphatase HisJ family protein [Bacillota bacterium]